MKFIDKYIQQINPFKMSGFVWLIFLWLILFFHPKASLAAGVLASYPLANGAAMDAQNMMSGHGSVLIWFVVLAVFMSVVIFYLLVMASKLRRARDKFYTLFNAVNVGVFQVSSDERLLAINDRALEILKLSRDEADEVRSWMADNEILDADGEEVSVDRRPIFRALHNQETVNDELYKVRYIRDEKPRWIRISAKAQMASSGGEVKYAFTSFYDVTELMEAEARLRNAEKLEVLGKVVSGLAHDFNNALAIVQSNLEFLRLIGEGDSNIDESVGHCLDATERCKHFTRRLLIFSRNKKKVTEDVAKPLDLNNYLSGIKDFLQHSLTPNIDLKFELSDGNPHVCIEAHDLENALINLAMNASDAIDEHGEITISTRILQGQDCDVVLSIEDTGRGIAEENLDKIFEPFFTTKDETDGMGLGLAMVYGFINRSGGEISVSSELGIGTRFDMTFPCICEEKKAPEKVSERVAPKTGTETILVIDDEEELLNSTCLVLGRLGYQTKKASGFDGAIETLKTDDEIDIVLSDILLPGPHNGIDIANFILENRSELPVILVSGQMAFYEEKAPKDPKVRLLHKPASANQLSQTLRELLD